MLKFKFKRASGQSIYDDGVRDRMALAVSGLPDGDYEWLLREQVKWDTDAMRRYFHGPCLKFIVEQFKSAGYMYSKDQIKEYLKYDWGPRTELAKEEDGRRFHRNGPQIPKSTAEWDFETYKKFINDVNAWCIEAFQCELPPAEQVE